LLFIDPSLIERNGLKYLKLFESNCVKLAEKRLKNPEIMKKLILSLAFAGSIMIAASACNSTKSVSGTSDSTMTDSTAVPVDTAAVPVDTTTTAPPDTTIKPM
jgi:hypothetical protein